jgi:Flp pilus assembly protein TadG
MTTMTTRRRFRDDERGAGTAELVIATPLLLLLVLTIAQFALYLHATHIAQAAASEALSAARVSGGTAAAGTMEGNRILAQLGDGPLRGTQVDVQRDGSQTSVRITGTVTNVIPFMTLTVHAEAVGPIEKFEPSVHGFINPPTLLPANLRDGGA